VAERQRSAASRLNSAQVHLGRALRRASGGPGLAAEVRSALGVVYFAGPIRMGDLAAVERVGAPAMTRTVGVLEAHGLVRRERDPRDQRAVLISVTPKAALIVGRGRDERVRQIANGLARLSPRSRARVESALDGLEELIDILERR
jgi:DNA-binding MarR family transcriptional regulator